MKRSFENTKANNAKIMSGRKAESARYDAERYAPTMNSLERIYHLPSEIKRAYRDMSGAEKVVFWTMLLAIPAIAGYVGLTYGDEIKDVTGKGVKKAEEYSSKAVKKAKETAASASDYISDMTNEAPFAEFSVVTPLSEMNSENYIFFNAVKSRDDGNIAKYRWSFRKEGNRTYSETETTESPLLKKNLEEGTYLVTLIVEDDKGKTGKSDEQRVTVSPKPYVPYKFTPDLKVFGDEEYKKIIADNLDDIGQTPSWYKINGKTSADYVRYYLDELHEGEESDPGQIGHPERLYLPKGLVDKRYMFNSSSNLIHAARHREQQLVGGGFQDKIIEELVKKYGTKRVREDQKIKAKITYALEKDAVKTQYDWERVRYNLPEEEIKNRIRLYMEGYKHWDPEQFALDFPEAP